MSATTPFEPARYLTRISGSDYLEVKWRLVWMRDQHPDATIETELVSHHDNTAVFRAMVSIPGGGSATGWKSYSWAMTHSSGGASSRSIPSMSRCWS